ncbi:DMT family transporter [Clostridium aminobutyricum]|uniref:DMT family transporter n=1 Tax=Clostridium aminobutyricum TaxID=33953 RepID=A0A939D7Y8_CLOAM|nr:DMT family transporter [Clostridium aminobutyricum]MBN7772747.1 DMT family transporter [Clostridium aminobutyricum]
MSKQLRADFMLLLVTLFWGVSYLLLNLCLTEMGPLTLNAYRFLIAFFAALIVAFPKLRNVNKITLKYSALIGFSLLFVYLGVTYGVLYTSLSNAGFLCALTVIITPILTFIMKKERPGKKMLLVLGLCLIGIGMMTLNEQLKPALGDLLCILCAFAYAIDLLIVDSAVHKEHVDAFQVGVYQLGFTGLYMFVMSLALEKPVLPSTTGVWIALLFLAIFCTGIAFIVQVVAQQYTSATHVGIIFALEPVFAGIVAFFFANERLYPRAYVGACLLMAGILIMEINFSAFFLKRKTLPEDKEEFAVDEEAQRLKN